MNYKMKRYIEEECSIAEIILGKFSIGDAIVVPIFGQPTEFIVEHIRSIGKWEEKLYFLSKDIIVNTEMTDVERILDYIERGMPKEFLDALDKIEHRTIHDYEMTRTVNILSLGNIKESEQCIGEDDMIFDGLRSTLKRRKTYENEMCGYWTCTPCVKEVRPAFAYVTENDYLCPSYEDCITGVLPCFSIKRKVGECYV